MLGFLGRESNSTTMELERVYRNLGRVQDCLLRDLNYGSWICCLKSEGGEVVCDIAKEHHLYRSFWNLRPSHNYIYWPVVYPDMTRLTWEQMLASILSRYDKVNVGTDVGQYSIQI